MMVVSGLTTGSSQRHSSQWLNVIWTNNGQSGALPRKVHHPSKLWVVEPALERRWQRGAHPHCLIAGWRPECWGWINSLLGPQQDRTKKLSDWFCQRTTPVFQVRKKLSMQHANLQSTWFLTESGANPSLGQHGGRPGFESWLTCSLRCLHNPSDLPIWLTKGRIPTYLLPKRVEGIFLHLKCT